MDTVTHLWNISQFMAKLENPLATELQTFYMRKCKNFKNIVELPKQKFGPSTMCMHCGLLWNSMNYQARIIPGRKMSKSIKEIVKRINEGDQDIPKVCVSLAQKCKKNEMNKLAIKCSVCSKQTELPLKKKNRLKPAEVKSSENKSNVEVPQSSRKKKKKKFKDRTAGLNISDCALESPLKKKNVVKTPTRPIIITPKTNSKKTLTSSSKKTKLLNLGRLKNIVNESTTTSTKSKSLHNFLSQLL